MKYALGMAALFVLAACTSTVHHHHHHSNDDGPYTMKDLEEETGGVYRPSDKDDSRERPERVQPVEDEPEPGPTVEKPTEKPKEKPKEKPTPEPGPKVEKPEPEPGPKVEKPKDEPEPKVEEPEDEPVIEPEPDRSGLIKAFISDVNRRMTDLEAGRLWKDLLKAKEKFEDRKAQALKKDDKRGKDDEAAWANTIREWYEVRYLIELFKHVNWNAPSDFEIDGPLNEEFVGACKDEHLNSADCAQAWAAYELIEIHLKEIRQFQTDVLKYNLAASKVYADEKQQKKWSTQKQKWQDATEGKFTKGDLQKYGR